MDSESQLVPLLPVSNPLTVTALPAAGIPTWAESTVSVPCPVLIPVMARLTGQVGIVTEASWIIMPELPLAPSRTTPTVPSA